MNICIFFEGTGQGVEGKATNVTRLHDAAAEYDGQLLFLEPGPGTRFGAYLSGKVAGADWRAAFGSARRVVEMLFPGSHSDVGGLYDDNHVVADVALAWVAAGAKAAGMRFKRGVKLAQRKVDVSRAVLHDSHALVSNLWGGLGSAIRNLAGLRLHPAWEK